MQSSPPQRAWEAPSPTTSKYSVDLAALETDSRSGASTPLPTQHVDKVLSEEIDGPSDFTLNMEKWMRGGALERGMTEGESTQGNTTENLFLSQKADLVAEEEKTGSHHTPTSSPPVKEAVSIDHAEGHDAEANGDVEDTSSDWDPYAESQKPQQQARSGFLQPSVEDYYSELTPAKSLDRNSLGQPDTQSPSRENVEPASSRASSPTPTPQRPVTSEYRPITSHIVHDKQMQELRARCQELERLNAVLTETLDEERRIRQRTTTEYEARLADAARREHDLTEMKAQAYIHKEEFRLEYADLKERVRKYESEELPQHSKTAALKQAHTLEVQNLQAQLDAAKSEHEQELQAIEQEIELEKRSREDAEEAARADRESLDETRAQVEKMKIQIHQSDDLREQIKEQLRAATMANEVLRGSKQADDDARAQENVKEELRIELKQVKQQLQAERKAHERLKSSKPASNNAHGELNDLRTKLNEATIERDEVQDRLDTAEKEKQAVEEELKLLEEVDQAVDAKLTDAIAKREEVWRKRMVEWKKERKLMSKTLLNLWGQLEMGDQRKSGWQEYKYSCDENGRPKEA